MQKKEQASIEGFSWQTENYLMCHIMKGTKNERKDHIKENKETKIKGEDMMLMGGKKFLLRKMVLDKTYNKMKTKNNKATRETTITKVSHRMLTFATKY